MNLASPRLYLERPGPLLLFWGVLRQACVAAYEDNCFGIAKGAAYSSLLAFFPVLASIAALLARANAESVARALTRLLFEVVPPGSEELVRNQFMARGQRPFWMTVGAMLLAVWAASGAMMTMMEGFEAAYRLPSGRPFLKQRGVAILLVFIVALPGIGSSMFIVFGTRAERWMLGWAGLSPDAELRTGIAFLFTALRYLIALATTVFVTGMLYCVGPNRRVKLRSAWPGAVLATVFWLAATSVFAWYVRNIANYSVLYGSIWTVIALVVWMYLLSVIALVGCEYNAVRERVLQELKFASSAKPDF
jgi:membrane protein